MELYCRACPGRPFRMKLSGEISHKRIYLGTVIGDSFVYKSAPCRSKKCKMVNVFIKGVDVEYDPAYKEMVVYL